MLLNKACQKLEKNEKFIVVGDFTTKASLAFKNYCYEGTDVIPEDNCNNGTHLKTFCMGNRLCIISIKFDYPNEKRYTW